MRGFLHLEELDNLGKTGKKGADLSKTANSRNCLVKKRRFMENLENENLEKTQEVKENQDFDYKKYREERIKNRVEKSIFKDLGVQNLDEIKEKFSLIDSYKTQIQNLEEKAKELETNKYKFEVLKSGIDEEFVDFVVDKLQKQVSDKKDFLSLFSNFKENNPRFLKQSKITVSTSPNFETNSKINSFSQKFNSAIRNKLG